MQIAQWLSRYQTLVNQIVEDDYLQFTMEVWSPMEPCTNKSDNNNNNNNEQQTCSPMEKWLKMAKLCKKNAFPFLNTKMMWDNMEFL
eukprot:5161772-Ditylum_brightwellii.AAC.1